MKPIAFIDSGLGGLPYLDHARSHIPGYVFLYGADNLGFPYGTKSQEEIIATFSSMVERIIRSCDPALFVVACNTASVVALSWLREHYPYRFVGVVPAVKPAGEQSANRSIGILATERTIKGDYLRNLIDNFAADCRVTLRPATNLIAAIERDPFARNRSEFVALLGEIRDEFMAVGVDSVVLGCTHFLLLKDLFFETMGDDLRILDSREGVTRQVKRVLHDLGLHENDSNGSSGASSFWLTGPSDPSSCYADIAEAYGLVFKGVLSG